VDAEVMLAVLRAHSGSHRAAFADLQALMGASGGDAAAHASAVASAHPRPQRPQQQLQQQQQQRGARFASAAAAAAAAPMPPAARRQGSGGGSGAAVPVPLAPPSGSASASGPSAYPATLRGLPQAGPTYVELRRDANMHFTDSRRCAQLAQEAYAKGDHDAASAHAEQSRSHKRAGDAANAAASARTLQARNAGSVNKIQRDLHALHVNEALAEVKKVLDIFVEHLAGGTMDLQFITGRGSHSVAGAKLLPAVEEYLKCVTRGAVLGVRLCPCVSGLMRFRAQSVRFVCAGREVCRTR
jgi:hypothetical protein